MYRRTILLGCLLFSVSLCGAAVITVNWDGSGDYTTIQAAIDDANELDTIIVAEGTYEENVNFNGKSITVRSAEPRDWDVVQSTIIDGNYSGSCVVFTNNETNDAVLEGFTLTHGTGTYVDYYDFGTGTMGGYMGGGIYCRDSSPTISKCNIVRNGAQEYDPVEPETRFGGGVALIGNCQADISGSIIAENISEGYGGGIVIRSATPQQATSTIRNCTIANNNSYYYYYERQYEVDCWNTQPTISNTIIYGLKDLSLLIAEPALVSYCDVKAAYIWDGGFPDYEDEPYDLTAAGGNISANPKFVSIYSNAEEEIVGDYHLTFYSPCIDAGDPAFVAGEGQTDIDGEDRVMGATVDMGVDEFIPKIVVTIPAVGEAWAGGSEHQVEWASAGISGTVDILYSTDGGGEWEVIEPNVVNTGSYLWLVPEVDSDNCVVWVAASVEPKDIEYEYSGVFSIVPYEAGPAVETQWPTLGRTSKRIGLAVNSAVEVGCVKWRYDTGGAVEMSIALGADGNAHIVSSEGVIHTVDPNGVVLWTYTVESAVAGKSIMGGPTVGRDGTLYFGCDDKLYAVDRDGQLRWTYSAGGFIYSSPAATDDGRLFFGSQDGKVYAIEADGSDLWEFEIPGPGAVSNAVLTSPAIGEDGSVYVGAIYSPKLYSLDPNTADIVWECDFEHLADPQNPESEVIKGGVFSAPVVGVDGTIYVSLIYDTNLYAVDPADGSIVWSTDMVGALEGLYPQELIDWFAGGDGWSEPVLGPDGTIYVSFDDPFIRAVNPDGSIKWITQVGMLGAFTMAAGADGLLYACSDDSSLYVLDGSDGKVLSVFDGEQFLGYPVIGSDGSVYISDAAGAVWAISSDVCGVDEADLARPADFDNNGVVNLADFALLAGQWMQCSAHFRLYEDVCLTETMYLEADADRSQYINIEDVAVLSSWWLEGN